VIELSRTGRIALGRGDAAMREKGRRARLAVAGSEDYTGGGV
jgi:hypothetical protein